MNHLAYMQPFYSTKQESEKLTKEDGIVYKKFNILSYKDGKLFFCEFSYHEGNTVVSKLYYEVKFFQNEFDKVNEKLEKLKLISYDEKKQLIYEQLILKFKLEKAKFELTYGKNSSHNLIQKY